MTKEKLQHFCVYYINFEKVFEIAMLLDNKVTVSEEQNSDSKHTTKVTARIQAMLTSIFNARGDFSYEYSKSSGLKKTVEIKSTNSVILRDLIDEIKVIDDKIESGAEGQLVILNDVVLSISNEEEMRQMKLIKQGFLDRFTHDDISIGELAKSLINDYFYLMTGVKGDKKYLIKIPSEVENEFENNYTIDDLLMGKVTLIGIYKGLKEITDLKNTFNYIANNNSSQQVEIIHHSSSEGETRNNSSNKYHYIDILAVVQKIKL